MAIYISDSKKGTVRQYDTPHKVEKAIETLLQQNEDLMYSETHPGYEVRITPVDCEILSREAYQKLRPKDTVKGMCSDCPMKTDMCQNGLRCPMDY